MIITIILAKADSSDFFLLPPAKVGGILNEWLLINGNWACRSWSLNQSQNTFINNKYASNKISINLIPIYPKIRKISI